MSVTKDAPSSFVEATVERRALVMHMVPVETRCRPTETDHIYSRYRRRGDLSGARSAWLSGLPELP